MARMKKLHFQNAIACEHVISSFGNKYTCVNIFSGDVVISAVPANLMVGFYIEHDASKFSANELILEMFMGKNIVAKVEARLAKISDVGSEVAVICVPVINIPVKESGNISVIARAEGYEPKTIIEKKVIVASNSAA